MEKPAHLLTVLRAAALSMYRSASVRSILVVAAASALLVLGAANIALQASFHEVEDGVLWVAQPEGAVAADLTDQAAAAGLRRGDVLQTINGRPVDTPQDVVRFLQASRAGSVLDYNVLRLDSHALLTVRLVTVPHGANPLLYFVLASVGILTLLVGASVWLRRSADHAAQRFFWVSVAAFGLLAFSFTGRLDRLDWFFYWSDEIATVLLVPLFLHFVLVFPDRPRLWIRSEVGARTLPLLYLPALGLGLAHLIVLLRAASSPQFYVEQISRLDRADYIYLAAGFGIALVVLIRASKSVRSVTARRQFRWIIWGALLGIVPFTAAYAVPFALGLNPPFAMQLTAVALALLPLAFASAILRYRLMDVEVIVKRALVWAVAIGAIAGIYSLLLRLAGAIFLEDSHRHNTVVALLATLVVVLLSRPVKAAIQTTFDRAFYRDRYDYRRALVGFARDLNTDLDLARLSERLVARIVETLLVDRLALLLVDERTADFTPIRTFGLEETGSLTLSARSRLAERLTAGGQALSLDDLFTARSLPPEDVDFWLERELYYFVACASKGRTTAVLALGRKASGEPLSSEDLALLNAVAGQVATALENGRLYMQLHVKAEEVDRMRRFNESIIESLDVGVVVAGLDGRVVLWNRALELLYGVPRGQAVGRVLNEVLDPEFIRALATATRDASGAATLYRISLDAPASAPEPRLLVNATTVPLRSGEGAAAATVGTMIIVDNVTSRVRLEEQLQISEKMASIGILAAGVAHEVNTPLTGISSFTQMLLDGADPDDPKTKVLEKIERQTFRAAKIVNALLNLSRSGGTVITERAPVDVNAVINDVLALLEHQLKVARIQVGRDLVSPAPVITGTEFKLQQVFLNLFLNARDAMPKGGWLSIVTRVEGDQAVVEVSDTGAGIPREHLSRIYDPFFTTKALGQGTGLGLSITYGIVREHDGSIACDSVLGKGTRFALTFPLASALRSATLGQ